MIYLQESFFRVVTDDENPFPFTFCLICSRYRPWFWLVISRFGSYFDVLQTKPYKIYTGLSLHIHTTVCVRDLFAI